MAFLENYPEEDIVTRMSYKTELIREAPGTPFSGICPECGRKGTFFVDERRQKAWCRACGFEDSTADHIKDRYGTDWKGAAEIIKGRKMTFRAMTPPPVLEDACTYFEENLKDSPAAAYLKERGVTDKTIAAFRLGYCPDGDGMIDHLRSIGYEEEDIVSAGLGQIKEGKLKGFFSKRLMIPIANKNSCTAGFGARIIDGEGPKYINSPESDTFQKHRMLYALDKAINGGKKDMILVEGYMDAVTLHQAGFDNAVAQMGTAFTASHARLLKYHFQKVHICLDSDDAGRNAVSGVIKTLLNEGVDCDVIKLSSKDPDEEIRRHGKESFLEAVNEAVTPRIWVISTGDTDWLINEEREERKNGGDLWRSNAQG